jgi:tRNA pseudouridine55 synthase
MDGILVLNKPAGPTSHDMVALLRRLSGTRRIGHGGTLDPFATGVLPLFIGRATRVVEYHLGDRKSYRATVCFGAGSTTDDLEGNLEPADSPPPDRDAVEAALGRFRGTIEQRPPAHSAIKVAGRRAYALARAGQQVELRPRTITIDRLDVVEWDGADPARPVAVIEVDCSAGTYVRALARDLGAAVGNAAYLGALTRTASGPFRIDDALAVDVVREAASEDLARLRAMLLPPETGLETFERLTVDAAEVVAISRGQFIRPSRPTRPGPAAVQTTSSDPAPAESDGHILVVDEHDRLIAIGTLRDGRLAPEKVLVDAPGAPSARADD